MKTKTLLLSIGAACLTMTAGAQTEPIDSLSTPGYEMLDELVIEAERPVMQSDGATLTYNVDEDPASETSNVLDILKKVPQVSVDADGNIRLNGSQAFKLQVNGLENPMLKQYAGQILESMPASMVVKIQVITEPGAKEDAEGTAGIINIITERKQSDDGYSGRLNLQANNRGVTPSVYALVKKNKVTLSANVDYQWGFAPQHGEQESSARYTDNGQTLKSITGQKAKHHYIGSTLNMSWEPNPDNLFTASANLFYLDANLSSLYNTSSMFGSDGAKLWSFSQDGNGAMNILNLQANASYRHNFGRDGNSLILSYLMNFGRTNLWIDRAYTDWQNYTPESLTERQENTAYQRGHTVQIDYANDFNTEHHKLEAGAKGIFRHNTAISDYNSYDAGAVSGSAGAESDIMQPQNIYAAYASYTGSYGHFGIVAGLRYEHTLMGVTDRIDGGKTFRNRLNDWVPNAALTWSFSPASNLRLAYQMRISRPSIDQVNPFSLTFSPYEMRKGNPNLTSERIHIVSLKYSSFGRVVGGQIGIEYNLSDNAISSFTYLQELNGINSIVTSYANIGRKQVGALTGLFNWNIIKNMSFSLNGRLAYNSLKDNYNPSLSSFGMGYRNHGWNGNVGANWNYKVEECKFSAYGAWFSKTPTLQGKNTGFYYYGISATRDFLADKSLTLGISASQFLQKSMSFKSHTATPNVIYDNSGRNLSAWSVGVSVAWKFGSLNTQVKKTGADLNNDDISTSSNKGQSSF